MGTRRSAGNGLRATAGATWLVASLALLALCMGCAQGGPRHAGAGVPALGAPLLDAGADAARLRADFDASVGRPRFLAILSPT
jgi:hypothetical protein